MSVAKKGKTEIDVCEEHGVWLDKGELEAITRRLRIGEATRMHLAVQDARASGKVSGWLFGPLASLFEKTSRRQTRLPSRTRSKT